MYQVGEGEDDKGIPTVFCWIASQAGKVSIYVLNAVVLAEWRAEIRHKKEGFHGDNRDYRSTHCRRGVCCEHQQ